MKKYIGITNTVYLLEDQEFAAGGEGKLYNISDNPQLVAKIYNPERLSREQEHKIRAMVEIVPKLQTYTEFFNRCAWPIDALYDTENHFAGFVMTKIINKNILGNVYAFGKRNKPWSWYIQVAANLAAIVYNIHELNQVIGDLNPKNILVGEDAIPTIIDTDSFHINPGTEACLRCKVGRPECVAPEIQGVDLTSAPIAETYTQESDNFSLAVILFQILMNGAHPFACSSTSGDDSLTHFQPAENISKGFCAAFQSEPGIEMPKYAPDINCLSPNVKELFRRAFVDGHKNPAERPKADEWHKALSELSHQLRSCTTQSVRSPKEPVPKHEYYYSLKSCPWCDVYEKMHSAIEPTPIFEPPGPILPEPWWRKHWKALCAGGLLGVILIIILCVVLMPGAGSLYISSTPSGASVYIDDIYKGTTPGTFEVTSGKHAVALKHSGYESYSTTVNVGKGEERNLYLTLSSTGGTIKVTSSPSGASIYVDGEYMGTTPKTLTLEPKKSSQYRIVVMKSGYYNSGSKLYTVTKGSSQNAEFTLSSSKTNTDLVIVDSTVPDDNGYTTVTYRIANYNSYPVSIKYEGYTYYSGSEKHLYDITFTVTLPANSATTKTVYNVYWPDDSWLHGSWKTTKQS